MAKKDKNSKKPGKKKRRMTAEAVVFNQAGKVLLVRQGRAHRPVGIARRKGEKAGVVARCRRP